MRATNSFTKKFILHLFLILTFSLSFFRSELASAETLGEVQFEEIKSWKTFGKRWATGFSENKRLIAIYDLSYPGLDALTPIAKWQAKDILPQVKNLFSDSDDVSVEALEAIDQAHEHSSKWQATLKPQNWWTLVRWNKLRTLDAEAPPSEFSLADIDFSASVSIFSRPEFEERLQKLKEDWVSIAKQNGFNSDLFSNFIFKRDSDGEYTVFFAGVESQKKISKPKKMIDLRFTPSGFLESLKIEMIQSAVGALVDLIPVPVVANIMSTALGRFFHFYSLMRVSHQVMALEFVDDMTYAKGVFPKDILDSENHALAAESLQFSQASLGDAFKWIWEKPYEQWQDQLKKEGENAEKGRALLKENGISATDLNPTYSLEKTESGPNLYIVSHHQKSNHQPLLSIYAASPEKTHDRRLTIEIVSASLDFGLKFLPIPFVGSVIKYFYNRNIASPAKADRVWEARLLSHLEQRELALKEKWSDQIGLLFKQRVNPLDLNPLKTSDLIEARKKTYSIK